MQQNHQKARKNKRLLCGLLFGALLMFGFGFLLVPFYDVMCGVLGLNGRASFLADAKNNKGVDTSRLVTVQFIAAKNDSLPIEFYPTTDLNNTKSNKIESPAIDIRLHPGENKQVAFYAKNDTLKTVTIQAIPSVSPGNAANYVRKTECFCFTNQLLSPGQSMLMPVVFHLDPELPNNIHTVNILYTVFDVTGKEYKSSQTKGKIS